MKRPLIVAVASLSCLACTSTSHVVEQRRTEITLLVPDAVAPAEPKADRVSLLMGSGRVLTYDNAIVRRLAGRIMVVDDVASMATRGDHHLGDVRAVQLERTSVTHETPSGESQATDGSIWALLAVAGVVGLIALAAAN